MTRAARRVVRLAAARGAAAPIAKARAIAARRDALKLPAAEAGLALEDDRMIVLDVRTARERAGGMIPGAIATSWRRPEVPAEDRDVLVVCSHGGRSLSAACRLRRRGVRARSLKGGMRTYVRGGGRVSRDHEVR